MNMLRESVISDAVNISKWCRLLYNLHVYLYQFYLFMVDFSTNCYSTVGGHYCIDRITIQSQ